MAPDLCTHCGEHVAGPARFCPHCGSPLAGAVRYANISSVKDVDLEARLGVKLRTPPRVSDPGKEKQIWGVRAEDLNLFLACSFMNAPMDTNFLLLINPQQDWMKWTPLVFIESMQGLKAAGHGCALFGVGDQTGSPSISDRFRSLVIPEARDAYISLREKPGLYLDLCPFFKQMDYGQLDKEIRGRWVTTVDDQRNYDVVAVLQLPLSGCMMKQRLLQHEKVIKKWIAAADDPELKNILEEVLNVLQSVVRQMPDGFADHLLCRGHVIDKGEIQSTALIDEEPETEKDAVRELSVMKSTALASRTSLFSTTSPVRAGLLRSQRTATLPIGGATSYRAMPMRRFP